MYRSQVINLVGQFSVEIPEGVVRKSCKVKYCVETLKVGRRDVPDVFAHGGKLPRRLSERARLKESAIQTDHFVTRIG
jgi:hypothetical protein